MQRYFFFVLVLGSLCLPLRSAASPMSGVEWWATSDTTHIGEVKNCPVSNNMLFCGYHWVSATGALLNWHNFVVGGPCGWLCYLNTQAFQGTGVVASYASGSPSPGLERGSLHDVYRAPTDDAGVFLSTAASEVTLAFNKPLLVFSFYWGSVDGYNTLELTRSDGTVETYTGANICSTLGLPRCFAKPNDDQSDTASIVIKFTAPQGEAYTRATFLSSRTSFEFDNLELIYAAGGAGANANAVPEPSSLGLLALGLSSMAGLIRKRLS